MRKQNKIDDVVQPVAAGLPELCYTVIDGAAPGERIGIIKRGVKGYYLTDYDTLTADIKIVEQFVAERNRKMGIKPSQVMAMRIGSMCGWNVPGANPEEFKQLDQREGVA